MTQDNIARERRLVDRRFVLGGRFIVTADTCFEPLRILRFDFFLAIEQRFDGSLMLLRVVRIERMFNAAQGDVQWYATLLPAFNQRPIDWAQHQMLATTANEGVFDF